MAIKLMLIAILVTSAFSGTALASGSHDHDHGLMKSASEHAGHAMGNMDHEGSSVGKPAPAAQATVIIQVITLDTMRYKFTPQPELKDGDIVKFVVTNQGKIPHEFSIGDSKEQQAHREMMRKMPNMIHQDGNTITIPPGETKEIIWQFKGSSTVVFACNIPGHFEAGMLQEMTIN